jgi:hypothetical protein
MNSNHLIKLQMIRGLNKIEIKQEFVENLAQELGLQFFSDESTLTLCGMIMVIDIADKVTISYATEENQYAKVDDLLHHNLKTHNWSSFRRNIHFLSYMDRCSDKTPLFGIMRNFMSDLDKIIELESHKFSDDERLLKGHGILDKCFVFPVLQIWTTPKEILKKRMGKDFRTFDISLGVIGNSDINFSHSAKKSYSFFNNSFDLCSNLVDNSIFYTMKFSEELDLESLDEITRVTGIKHGNSTSNVLFSSASQLLDILRIIRRYNTLKILMSTCPKGISMRVDSNKNLLIEASNKSFHIDLNESGYPTLNLDASGLIQELFDVSWDLEKLIIFL